MLFPSLPEVIENHIMEYASDYHDKYKRVLQDIIKATTCHGCGVKSQVALIGYSNRFCNKGDWKAITAIYLFRGFSQINNDYFRKKYNRKYNIKCS